MKKILLSIILLMALNSMAFGAKVASLYQVELPVAAQSDAEKTKAIKVGLPQVLVKVSGDPKVTENPQIKVSIDKPENYVQEFNYVATPNLAQPYVIQIRFNSHDIDELLKNSKASHWGETRPKLLVWLALTNLQQSTVIVGGETGGGLSANMKQRSEQYGLPLIFPALDVADLSQVLPQDVIQMDLSVLREAGRRYSAEAMLIGKVNQTNEGYQGQWRLVLSDAQWDWTFNDKTAEGVASQVLDRVSQTLAKHYLVTTESNDHALILIVNNVSKPDELSQLISYLKQIPAVKQVQLQQITGESVEVSLQVQCSLENFEKNVAVGQHLVLKSQAGEDKLIYEWMHA